MRQDLKQRLIIWQKDLHEGESKRVMLLDSPAHNGEFVIQLEMAIQRANARFTLRKKYQTTAQANSIMDPMADISELDHLIDSLDHECAERLQLQ